MASKITITFNSLPSINDVFAFTDNLTGVNLTQTFVENRQVSGETKIGGRFYIADENGNNTAQNLQSTVTNYRSSFDIDYNTTSLYTFEINEVNGVYEVVVNATNPQSEFVLGTNTTNGSVTAIIENDVLNTFEITNVTITEADANPCQNAKISITTSERADSYKVNNDSSIPATSNPIVFDYARGSNVVRVTKDGVSENRRIIINLLTEDLFDLDILYTPNLAELNINLVGNTSNLNLEYSLNDTDYQTSQRFTGLDVGNYILFIRDGLGCSLQIGFEVVEFTPTIVNNLEPISQISNLNPLRFKNLEQWNNCDNPINIDNALSFEENVRLNQRNFVQLFNNCDTITTQVKTNYETVEAFLIDCDGNETDLIVEKKTNNLNIIDIRDVRVNQKIGGNYNSLTCVTYSGGNRYDSEDLSQNGTYSEFLPSWIDVEEYINLEGFGWFKVLAITNTGFVINANFNDFSYSENDILKGTTYYNAVDYERYEFNINALNLSGYYQVRVETTDSFFEDKTFLSEYLHVKENHNRTHNIEYYNTEANELNFIYGMRGKLRLPYIHQLKLKPNEEQEVNVTDTSTVLLDAKNRFFYEMTLMPLPTSMVEKLSLVFSQDRIRIDGINYLKIGEIESTPLGTTNTYKITGVFVKSDYVFKNASNSGNNEVSANGNPLSVSQEGGFLVVD